jgi:type II secretory pathway component GspD/PulD (secretin)
MAWLSRWLLVVLSLCLVPTSIAQTATPVSLDAGGLEDGAPIRFNFKEAPFDQVLDFIGRESGLPIIYEVDAPKAPMTFISPVDYSLAEAITILNLSLARHEVRLRHEGDYLYLSSREGAFRSPEAVTPGDARPDAILTVNIPLNNALASVVADQLKPLVTEPGQIIAVPSQNMLIVVDEAARCRHIQEVVAQIDAMRPTALTTEVFRLRNAKAESAAAILTTLVGGREQTTYTDKNENVHLIDDVTKPALNITADVRTNSVIVVGPPNRVETARTLIEVIDVGDADSGETEMATYALRTITPEEAATHLNALFQGVDETSRPTVIALPETSKVTIVASSRLLAQARGLLAEVDPGSDLAQPIGEATSIARTIELTYLNAVRADELVARLLSPRQNSVLRRAPAPDGRSLIVVGPGPDVEALSSLLAGLDTPGDADRRVRLVRISRGDPQAVISRAEQFAEETKVPGLEQIAVSLDAESRTVTLIGPGESLDRFEALIGTAEQSITIDLETRTYEVTSADAGVLAGQLERLAKRMLEPADAEAFTAPTVEALDELDQIIVRAEPGQFGVIDELVEMLDVPQPGSRQFSVVRIGAGQPAEVVARAQELYAIQSADLDDAQAGTVEASIDAPSGSVILSGTPGGIRMMSELLAQVQRLVPPRRTTRVIDIESADAAEIIGPLRELLSQADPIDESRSVPEPTISVIERTNSLLVTAEDAQHEIVRDFVSRLDRLEPTELPALRLLQLRTADAAAIAEMLTAQYSKRPQADRVERPVEVRSDATTNTLIVSAHTDLFAEIKAFVEELNTEGTDGPERVTELFPLKAAKAEAVAAAMDKLYPEPPMPHDTRGRPMPWLQEEKEVTVSAESSSNSLIIDAPVERMASLRELAEKLDRVGLPAVSELRTYHITGADLDAVARTLKGMAGQGILSAPPQAGMQAAEVMIETEPLSSTLIVAGDSTTFERVEQVLEDIGEVPVERGLRIVPIANAQASDVRDRALAIYDAQVSQIPGAGPVDVSVDEASNSLEIVADAEAMQRFMGVIEELQRQAGPAREARLIELRFAKVGDVIDVLRELVAASESLRLQGGPMPVFEPIESTNSILAAAQPSQLPIIEALIQGLDSRQTAERPPLRILRLRSTDAESLASVLQQSYERRSVEERAKKPVEIRADIQTNTLIVSAHDEMLPEIEAIVAELNETTLTDEDREIRIFPLKVAQAEELARTIDQIYLEPPMPIDARGRPMPQLQLPKEVVVRADRATNSLIVDAPSKRLSGFEQIVRSLDQQNPGETQELRTYRIERADLDAVAKTLRDLAEEGALASAGRKPVTVSTEPVTRSLVVSGPSEIFGQVEEVLATLDATPDMPPATFRFYALKHARAERLEPLLTNLLATRISEERANGAFAGREPESLLEVAADRPSNLLIISAPEPIQQLAEELITALDTEAAQVGKAVVRVVPLTYANAADAAATLNQAASTMDMPSGLAPTILAAVGSNALIMMGAEADLAKVESLIEPLDSRPMDAQALSVETFQLEHADATTLAPSVAKLLDTQSQTNPQLLRERLRFARDMPSLLNPATVTVEADARTNSLVVSAPAEIVDLAREVIERLDQPAGEDRRTTAMYTPVKADAAALAESVRKIAASSMTPARVPLEIVPDARSGSIVVVGDQAQVAEALRMLADFDDRAVDAPAADVQAITLVHADASSVAGMLQGVLADRSRWPEALRRAEQAGIQVPAPSVSADASSNRIFIGAPTALMPLARQLVATMDVPAREGAVGVRVFRLDKGDAASVGEALRSSMEARATPGAPAPTITPETASNAVLVAGTPEQLDEVETLIESLDANVEPEGLDVRTIYLRHARAEAVAPVIERILTRESPTEDLPYWMRWQLPQEDTSRQVRVAAEPRLNAVVVSAPRALLDVAEGLATQLDVVGEADASGTRLVRVIPLANADANELAENLNAMFEDVEGSDRPPVIRVDGASNALIVRATSAQMDLMDRLAGEIDAATMSSSRQLRTIPVDRSKANAAMLAETLQRLLEQQGGVTVEVISVEELLERPAAKPGAEGGPSPFPGDPARPPDPLVSPSRLLPVVIAGAAICMQPEGEETRGQASVTIAVDPVSNSIVVIGSPRMTERIAELASELESQLPREPTKVRLVELPDGVDGRAIEQLVNRTITQIGRASDTNPGGFTGSVSAAYDASGESLIIWANDTDFDPIRQLITSVARAGETRPITVKIYPLSNAQADDASRTIQDLLSPEPRGRQVDRVRRAYDFLLDGENVATNITPDDVRVVTDPSGRSLIVASPPEIIPLIDRFVAMIDQDPVGDRMAIRRYELENADAEDTARTLQSLFEAQLRASRNPSMTRAQFVGDARTNAVLVTASSAQHDEVTRLLGAMDAPIEDDSLELEIITLQNALPSVVESIVTEIALGRDPGKRDQLQISADDESNLFVVRALPEDLEEIRRVVEQVDTADVAGLPVRSIKLERADAQGVATSLQQFFRDRAGVSARGGRRAQNRVAIVGDRRTATLVVAASDEDYAQVLSLVEDFDAATPSRDLTFKIIPLQNARVSDIADTVESIASEMQFERMWGNRSNPQSPEDRVFVRTNDRTNSVVVMGQGETLAIIEKIIAELDLAPSAETARIVRAVKVEWADLDAIADVITETMQTPNWRWWMGPDPDGVSVHVDEQRRMLIMVGARPRVEEAASYVEQIVAAGTREGLQIASITLEHAQSNRAARSLDQFFEGRARALGLAENETTIIGSEDGNVIIVSADAENMALVNELVEQLDKPELGTDRAFEMFVLKNSDVTDAARVVSDMFPRSGRSDEQVIVTPMESSNSLIVSAPERRMGDVQILLTQIDSPPTIDDTLMVAVPLTNARAEEVQEALDAALPEGLKVKITPVTRNNSVLVTGSREVIDLVRTHIERIDAEPKPVLTAFRRIALRNTTAFDATITLRELLRGRVRSPSDPEPRVDYDIDDNTIFVVAAVDEIDEIVTMAEQLDVPTDEGRRTDFIKLEFAGAEQVAKALDVFYGRLAQGATPAERNVMIVPDNVSNSLVISAGETEWAGIRGLLEKLDIPEYDTSRQLVLIPLLNADAQSVARALNEGFQTPLEQQFRREQARLQQQQQQRGGQGEDRAFQTPPTALIDAGETPIVSAEVQTNSLVVFAGRNELERIEAIVKQLDKAEFVDVPQARVIALASGRASQIAQSIREIFVSSGNRQGRRSVIVVGDDQSNSLIVRAEERDYAQVLVLAEALQQASADGIASPRVLRLVNVPAMRLRDTLLGTFQPTAEQLGEPLAIQVDRDSNALVIASSDRLFMQIQEVARELDGALPGVEGPPQGRGLGRGVIIIDVEHNSPEQVRRMLEDMGLTRPQPEDRPGVVAEPVTIVPLVSRSALAVVASPADAEAVVSLVRAIDAEPTAGSQHLRVVALTMATASNLAGTLNELLDPAAQTAGAPAGEALAEHLRRLSVGFGREKNGTSEIDLAQPIRIIPDDQTNSILISSTEANVTALVDVVHTLDSLPIGEAVVVRIFPLENASATRVQRVITDLFQQGEQIRRLPGTQLRGLPESATGKALAGDIAISTDDRTNSLIVAGREESVALVEVLIADLDSDEVAHWVEPTLITLEHADATTLAETLDRVLVQGFDATEEATALQRQTARLRIVSEGGDLTEADLFAPMTGLVIEPEAVLNALIVVGTPANVNVVAQLAEMLDVEAASAANTVRVFPLEFAAADRVAGIAESLFRQREDSGALREEDRLVIAPDTRTNSLIVSTSPRSFAILEGLLKSLDGAEARATVGMHIVPVPGGDVSTLAPKIERLMRERIQAAQRGGVTSPMDTFTIEPEPANNVLIVSASDENLRIVNELIAALSSEGEIVGDAEVTELIALANVPAGDAAETINGLYVDKENERRGEGAVRVVANDRLKAILVSGTSADIAAIRELASQLDGYETPTVQEIRRIELKAANAFEVVQLLEQVLAGRPISGQRGLGDTQVIKLRYLRTQMYEEMMPGEEHQPTEAEIDGAIRDLVRLTPDLRTNSVLVNAPTPVVALIEKIVLDLDGSTSGERRIERFQLEHADAYQTAQVLQDLFSLRQEGDTLVMVPTGAQLREPEQDESFIGDRFTPVPDVRRQLSITIDARTNSLLVSGTEEYLDQVRRVILDLDGIETAERVRLVYQLQNARADEVQRVLTEFFQQEIDRIRGSLDVEQQGSLLAQLEREVTVIGDGKTNKVLVSASPRYTESVQELIAELDAAPPRVMIEVLLAEVTLDSDDSWGLDLGIGPIGPLNYQFNALAAGNGVINTFGSGNLALSSTEFSLLIRALQEQGKLEVLSDPQISVNNNEEATIEVGDEISLVTGSDRSDTGNVSSEVERRQTGITLNVTPSISSDGFVRLDVHPQIERVSDRTTQINEDFNAPIINRRSIDTVVTVRDGETVVLGGLMQKVGEKRVSKIPFFGDIPILGLPFKSIRKTEIKTELLIILTPRVIPGGVNGVETLRDVTDSAVDELTDPGPVRHFIETGRIEDMGSKAKDAIEKKDDAKDANRRPPKPGVIRP